MNKNVKIPVAYQIRVDDVAWHIGADQRYCGRPSRSGMTRDHVADDYPVLNELGKALNQKINCAIVLGEWDRENILRGQNEFTWCPDTWDRKNEINYEYAEKAFDLLENSPYIAYTCHGVMHGHYDKGQQVLEKEFYNHVYDEKSGKYTTEVTWHTDDILRKHLDYFFKLYDMWGFKKKVGSFACGNGNHGSQYAEGNIRYAQIFKEYGFDIWENGWHQMVDGSCAVIEGIVALAAVGKGNIPWNAYDVDPDEMELFNSEDEARTDYGIHWPNLIRYNPKKNLENLEKWVNYFKRQEEVFGTMCARDVYFAASQAVYNKYASITFEGDKCIIDLKEVDNKNARALKDEFYISFKNGTLPKGCTGGTIEEYETKKAFKTYKVTRENSADRIEINL